MWFSRREKLPEIDLARLARMSSNELHTLLSGVPEEAARWVEAAARRGLPEAQTRLGRMLLDGTGVKPDPARAVGWFKTAARHHDADAMNMLGRCYELGWGVAPDPAEATGWYRKSAERGDAWGQYNFAHRLLDGAGIAQDRARALHWYLQAAQQGHDRAMNLAARCYEEGWGTARDLAQAINWYRRSAEAGYFRAQYNYATALAQAGRVEDAAAWFREATEGGTPELRRTVAEVLGRSHHPALQAVAERARGLLPQDA